MKVPLRDSKGVIAGEYPLPANLFAATINKNVLYEAIKHHLANKRQGTVSVKTVATVHGTTAKPWRQKGTGRARAGTNKSPLWKGGGVIFGPHPRNFSYHLPKKIQRAAYISVFSFLAQHKKVHVMEALRMETYKTQEIVKILGAFTDKHKVIYLDRIPTDADEKEKYVRMCQSAKNIAWLKVAHVDALNIKQLYYTDELVCSTSALERLQELATSWTSAKQRRPKQAAPVTKSPEQAAPPAQPPEEPPKVIEAV